SNACGTSVQVALAGHHAADGKQRSGAETEFIGAENRRDNDVPRKFQASVHAEREARTKARATECVIGFAHANFPRRTGVLDGGERTRTRPAVVSADGDGLATGLRDARGHDADSRAG